MADILAFHFRMLVQNSVYRQLLQAFTLLRSLNMSLNFLPKPVKEELISLNLLLKISVIRNLVTSKGAI